MTASLTLSSTVRQILLMGSHLNNSDIHHRPQTETAKLYTSHFPVPSNAPLYNVSPSVLHTHQISARSKSTCLSRAS